MGLLSREAILKADDLPRRLVSVPEWGGEVFVRTLSGTERDAFEASFVKVKGRGRHRTQERDPTNYSAKLAALCVCDEQGKRLFSERDVAALAAKSSAALNRIVGEAMALNGMTEEAVEEAEGNSETGRNGTSISPSPATSAAPSENCSPASAPTS